MKIKASIFFFIIFSFFFICCKKEISKAKLNYNEKANQLIQQLISKDSCQCILEISKESLIYIYKLETRDSTFEKFILKKLSLKDRNELDSLEKLSENFKIDEDYLKKKNIKLIKRDSVRIYLKDSNFYTKTCKRSFNYFIKPIFNKEYNKAIIDYGSVGVHGQLGLKFFEYKNNKWKEKNGS